jgi:hypothetical protein
VRLRLSGLRVGEDGVGRVVRRVKFSVIEMQPRATGFRVSLHLVARVKLLLNIDNQIERPARIARGSRGVTFEGFSLWIDIQRDIAIDLREILVFAFDHPILPDDDMGSMDIFRGLIVSGNHPDHQTRGIFGEKSAQIFECKADHTHGLLLQVCIASIKFCDVKLHTIGNRRLTSGWLPSSFNSKPGERLRNRLMILRRIQECMVGRLIEMIEFAKSTGEYGFIKARPL